MSFAFYRTPQTFTGQPPRPPPRQLTPEQEQQRRLQENIAQRALREQEVRDVQRQQQAQLQKLYPQGVQFDPVYLAQLQQAQQQYVQLPEARQFVQAPQQTQQYIQVPAQQQEQYVAAQTQTQAEPERVSYSQVQFGSTKLPRRLTKFLPQNVQTAYAQPQAQAEQQLVYTQPQQQAFVQSKPQTQLVYTTQPQEVVYPQQNDVYQQQARRPEVKQALPQQYLIETTKVEPTQQQQQQVVTIPKQRAQFYYRPQPSYQDIQASILAQQQQAHYAQQQLEASTTSVPPSRSSIFVSTARTPELKTVYTKTQLPEVRIPKPNGQRPLSQSELNALINVGFKVNPSQSDDAPHFASYQPQFAYYRELGKRQNKPVPRPVSLTPEERRALAKEGIRNLYRIETAESNDSPVTYVLALSSPSKH